MTRQLINNEKPKPMVIIIDNNPLSIMGYAEEFPENWKKICDALDKEMQKWKCII